MERLYPGSMEKRQVLLICLQPLLSEGLQRIFQSLEDVDLVQLHRSDLRDLEGHLQSVEPDIIVVAGDLEDELVQHLIPMLLSRCKDVPVIWTGLEDSDLHIYSSQTLPANRAGLTDFIRHLTKGHKKDQEIPPNPSGGDTYEI
ncbi:MAG: hypothetical protein GX491_01635 [Chloroflexi bacterium]|nr:hypothetical protein [Chloroflexota bacterium]